jgi:hypothetical protein
MALNDEKRNLDLEEAEDEPTQQKCGGCCGFCAFVDRYRVFTIVAFAAIGLCVGVGLSYWDPTDSESKKVAIQWIGLIGDLFLRALKCAVLPVRYTLSAFATICQVFPSLMPCCHLYFSSHFSFRFFFSFISSARLREHHHLCRGHDGCW